MVMGSAPLPWVWLWFSCAASVGPRARPCRAQPVTTTTATTTTRTVSPSLISSGAESGDYYFDEDDDYSSGSGSLPIVSSVTEKIEYFSTTRAAVSEGSGSDHDDEVLIKPKDYLDTTDDEDFTEGSGKTPDFDQYFLLL